MAEVLKEHTGSVLRLALNRPHRLNAVSEALYQLLIDELHAADDDPDIRAVLLTGRGRAFCVGADLKAHAENARTEEQRAAYIGLGQQVCALIQRMSTPVVASVHGYALGAGAEIAVSADFLVVAEDALMGFPEVAIGSFVGGAVTHRLPRLVGLRRATELLIMGERFSGREALSWGLANVAPPAADLDAAALALAIELTSKAPLSMARMKSCLNGALDVDEALRVEANDLLAVMHTEDWAEGVAAFAGRRAPVFHGR